MSDDAPQNHAEQPADQANVVPSPTSGVVPPVDRRFGQPNGNRRNNDGRPRIGASCVEWMNVFDDLVRKGEMTEDDLRTIAKSKRVEPSKRSAAQRLIRMCESGDIANFAGLLRGENNLEDLRGMGVETDVVKKFKQKTRVVPKGNDDVEEVIEREIEFHDRSGEEFDRVCDRSIGKPRQTVTVDANPEFTSPDERAAEAGASADRLRSILRPAAG